MPVEYSIDHTLHLIRVAVTGEVSSESILEADAVFREDKDANPEYDQLLDFAGATGGDLSREAVIELISRPPFFSPQSRRAVVVSTKVGFGMARMFELMRDDKAGTFRVFYELHEAEGWLKR